MKAGRKRERKIEYRDKRYIERKRKRERTKRDLQTCLRVDAIKREDY